MAGRAVFPEGPASAAQRGICHPSGLSALGAKGCIKGLRCFAQDGGRRPLKIIGRQFG